MKAMRSANPLAAATLLGDLDDRVGVDGVDSSGAGAYGHEGEHPGSRPEVEHHVARLDHAPQRLTVGLDPANIAHHAQIVVELVHVLSYRVV